jgi:hypothetical protein
VTTIWLVPLLVTTVGLLLVAGFARRAADEAAAFRRSVLRFGELRPALVEVRTEIDRLRR